MFGVTRIQLMKEATAMKKAYEPMKVTLVGKISNVVNKSGSYTDLSQNFSGKSPDEGEGQENNS